MLRVPLLRYHTCCKSLNLYPQVVRYRGGEKFGYHYDAVPPTLLGNGGQRAMTLYVLLPY